MSSLRHFRRRSCEGKTAYADKTAAVAALIAMQRVGLWKGQRSYRCAFSGHWHLGRKPLTRIHSMK